MFLEASDPSRHLHFVTGKLAQNALRHIVEKTSKELGFSYSIDVMPITVAALITPQWLTRHISIPSHTTHVILPGFIGEELDCLRSHTQAAIVIGPKDLRDLPEFLSGKKSSPPDLSEHAIEIIAEINHAPRLTIQELVRQAEILKGQGADIIDIGCQPGETWDEVGEVIRALVENGFRVSIDSFNPREVEMACRAGASLVLSVNSRNVEAAAAWQTEVVAIPDTPDNLDSLDETIEILTRNNTPFRLDPILEPIGMGLIHSLVRYHRVRQSYPDAKMMMGIGNLTELTDVDSAGINLLLLGICAELRIESVLTTQVINWARSSVRECDLARRLVHYAVQHQVPPKRLDDSLVMLRDPRLHSFPESMFDELASTIRDSNYRIFAQNDQLHLISARLHLMDSDPFRLFDRLMETPNASNVDPSHAFYLGFELAKALTAIQLGKQYDQDRSLRWGWMTVEERHHRISRKRKQSSQTEQPIRKPKSNPES